MDLELSLKNKQSAQVDLIHGKTYLQILVSQSDIPLQVLQIARIYFLDLLEEWKVCQTEYETLLKTDSLAVEIASAYQFKQHILNSFHEFKIYINSKLEPSNNNSVGDK